LTKAARYLLDVNVLIALLYETHVHHARTTKWFRTPALQWALCPFTETGFVRYMTRPNGPGVSMEESTRALADLAGQPGYHYLSASHDWKTLTKPFEKHLHGYKQVPDAYLLGLAIRNRMSLVTFDQALWHLAGDLWQKNLLILEEK
jgi:uncharacterized protein